MATGGCGSQGRQDDDRRMTLNHEDRLKMLSEGSFRCRPCRNCGNNDPSLIELEAEHSQDGRTGNGEGARRTDAATQRLRCKKCETPYTLLTSTAEELPSFLDDDDGLDLAGIECCNCSNTEPACFSVSRYDNGHLRSITCLVCDHGNTFHESDAGAGKTSSDASEEVEFSGAGVECIKCPNTYLFDFTFYPDGRIHKITCKVCMHGNTFHTQPTQAVATRSAQQSSSLWSAVALASGSVLSVAQNLWQKSAHAALNQVSQQVSSNVANSRPVGEGLRRVGAVQVASVGKNLVLEVGDMYLKRMLPMIPDATRTAFTRKLSEVVSQFAIQLLAGEREKKQTANGKRSANGKTPENGKTPPDA